MAQTPYFMVQQDVPLQLYFYGNEQCTPTHSYGPAVRNHYLFVYTVRGKGYYRSGDVTYALGAGQSFFMFPGVLAAYNADRNDPWEYKWIGFLGTQAGQMLEFAGIGPRAPTFRHIDRDGMLLLFDELERMGGSLAYKELMGASHIYRMMALLLRDSQANPDAEASAQTMPDRYVTQAIRFMTRNYAEQLSVPLIASQVGLERSYFTKMFTSVTGKPPHAYLLEVRMNKAAELLGSTALTVEAIAYSTGFSTPNHFSSAFRKHFGVPPLSWRKQRNSAAGYLE